MSRLLGWALAAALFASGTASFAQSPVTVSFGADAYEALESAGPTALTLRLDSAPSQAVRIPVVVTPQNGASHSVSATEAVFPSGAAEIEYEVWALHDSVAMEGRGVELSFGELPPGVVAGTPSTASVTFVDIDGARAATAAGTGLVGKLLAGDFRGGTEYNGYATGNAGFDMGGLIPDAFALGTPEIRVHLLSYVFTPASSANGAVILYLRPHLEASETAAWVLDIDGRELAFESASRDRAGYVWSLDDHDDAAIRDSLSSGSVADVRIFRVDLTARMVAKAYQAEEGEAATITVTVDRPIPQAVTAPVEIGNPSGVPLVAQDRLTVEPGETVATFTVDFTENETDDPDREVVVGIGATLGVAPVAPLSVTVTVLDDDPVLAGVTGPANVPEGGTGMYRATLASPHPGRLTLQLVAAGLDQRGIVSIPAGMLTSDDAFEVAVPDDDEDGDTRFVVKVGVVQAGASTEGLDIRPDSGLTVTVADNDPPAAGIAFTESRSAAIEGSTNPARVLVTLDAAPGREVRIPIEHAAHGGSSGADYTATPATLTFGASDTRGTVSVAAVRGSPGGRVELRLGALPAGVTVGGLATMTVDLVDFEFDLAANNALWAAVVVPRDYGSASVGYRPAEPLPPSYLSWSNGVTLEQMYHRADDGVFVFDLEGDRPSVFGERRNYRDYMSLHVGEATLRLRDGTDSASPGDTAWSIPPGSELAEKLGRSLVPGRPLTVFLAPTRHEISFPDDGFLGIHEGGQLTMHLPVSPPAYRTPLTMRISTVESTSIVSATVAASVVAPADADTAPLAVTTFWNGIDYHGGELHISFDGGVPVTSTHALSVGSPPALSTVTIRRLLSAAGPLTKTVGIWDGSGALSVGLSSGQDFIPEGEPTSVVVTLSLANSSDRGFSLPILRDGGAVVGRAVYPAGGPATFSHTVTTDVEGDNVVRDRPAEHVELYLAPHFRTTETLTLTVADADFARLSLRRLDSSGEEGEAVRIEAALDPLVDSLLTVGWAFADGSGGTGDASPSGGSVVFRPLQSAATISFDLADDNIPEAQESWTVSVSGVSGDLRQRVTAPGDVAPVSGVIAANDAPTLTLAGPANVAEGAVATYTVSVTGGTPAGPVRASVRSGGTAARGADHTLPPLMVTVGAGATEETFTVSASRDGVADPGEVVVVALSEPAGDSPGGVRLAPHSRVTTTITEPNRQPAFDGGGARVTVDESIAPGTHIGLPLATDPDGEALTYSLSGDDLFEIGPDTGMVSVRPSAFLDFESRGSHTMTIHAGDGKDLQGARDGQVDATVRVTVAVSDVPEPPNAPGRPRLSSAHSGSEGVLRVSWDPPDTPGSPPVTAYMVEHRTGSGPFGPPLVVGRTPFAEIRGLTRYANYEVRVKALNEEGESGYSDAASAHVLGEEPVTVAFKDRLINVTEGSGFRITVTKSGTGVRARVSIRIPPRGGTEDIWPRSLSATIGASDLEASARTSVLADSRVEGIEEHTAELSFASGSSRLFELGSPRTMTIAVFDGGTDPDDHIRLGLSVPRHVPRGGATVTATVSIGSGTHTEPVSVSVGHWGAGGSTVNLPLTLAVGQTVGTVEFVPGGQLTASVGDVVSVSVADPEGGGAGKSFIAAARGNVTVIGTNSPARLAVSGATATVGEDLAGDSPVGDPFSGSDPDGDTLAYSIRGDGRFAIDPAGQVRLRSGSRLDHEAGASHLLTVEVSDGKDGLGLSGRSADDSATLTVLVEDVPEPPPSPRAPGVEASPVGGHTRLAVSWNAPSLAGAPPASSYDVQYRTSGTGEFVYAAERHAATSVTIGGLGPAAAYDVRVRARSDEGESGWSGHGTASTDPDLPPAFGRESAALYIGESAPWGAAIGEPLGAADPEGEALSYSISGTGVGQVTVGAADGRMSVAANSRLDHESAPHLQATVTAADPSGQSATLTVTINVTDDPEPPDPPDAPVVTADGSDAVTVSWSPALTGEQAPITGYDVDYRRAGSSDPHTRAAHTGTGTEARIDGLTRRTRYEVRVRAKNANGTGGWSDPGTGRTESQFLASVLPATIHVNEGAAAFVTVSVTPTPTVDVTVSLHVVRADIPGVDNADFSEFAIPHRLTVMAGESEEVSGVGTVDDSDPERDEAIFLEIFSVTTGAPGSGLVAAGAGDRITITQLASDVPVLSLSGPDTLEKGATGAYTVAVGGEPLAGDVTAQIGASGTAEQGTEYSLSPTEVSLGVGETEATFALSATAGSPAEAGDTIVVTLGSLSGPGATGSGASNALAGRTGKSVTILVPNSPPAVSGGTVFAVDETVAAGTTLGSLTVIDPDMDEVFRSVSGADAALFTLEDGGGIVLAAGATLDHEADASHLLTVEIRDRRDADGLADDAADATVTLTVNVANAPEALPAPSGLGLSSARHTAVTVTWSALAPPGIPPPIGYDIERRRHGGAGANPFAASGVNQSGTSATAEISGLEPGTGYEVRVRARNGDDVGGPGSVLAPWGTVTVSTAANSAPVFASGSVTLSVNEDARVGDTIGTAQTATDADGDPVTYSLSAESGPFETLGIASGTGPTFLARSPLDHESEPTLTRVLLARDTFGGTGRLTVTVEVGDVDEPPPRMDPPDVSVEVSERAVTLAVGWTAPDTRGIPGIDSYVVGYRVSGSGAEHTEVTVAGTTLSAGIPLEPEGDLTYEVQVRALNDEGAGPWSDTDTAIVRSLFDMDVDGVGAATAHDALLLFYSWRFGDFLRANPRLLDLVYGRILRQSGSTLTPRDVLDSAVALRTLPGASTADIDGTGDTTAHDALLLFYSWRFGDFLRANPRLLDLVYGRILRQSGSTLTPAEVLGNAELLL